MKDVLTAIFIFVCWLNLAVNFGNNIGHVWAATAIIISTTWLHANEESQ